LLAEALQAPEPRDVKTDGSNVFLTVGVKAENCAAILSEAERQIKVVHEALGH
jgi:hypothetical protein